MDGKPNGFYPASEVRASFELRMSVNAATNVEGSFLSLSFILLDTFVLSKGTIWVAELEHLDQGLLKLERAAILVYNEIGSLPLAYRHI